jgi:hypothetical protein
MQEDKELKDLLMKWSVENPSAEFTSHVMQRITSASVANAHTQPLFKQSVPRILLYVFILVCIVLFTLCFTTPFSLPFQFTVELPAKYFAQGFYFLIAFWVVMLFNLILKRYSIIAENHWSRS